MKTSKIKIGDLVSVRRRGHPRHGELGVAIEPAFMSAHRAPICWWVQFHDGTERWLAVHLTPERGTLTP